MAPVWTENVKNRVFQNLNGANSGPKKYFFWESLLYLFKGFLEDTPYKILATQMLWLLKETHFCAKDLLFFLKYGMSYSRLQAVNDAQGGHTNY